MEIGIKNIWEAGKKYFISINAHKIPFHEKFFFACCALLILSVGILFLEDLNPAFFTAETTVVFTGDGLQSGAKLVKDNISDLGIVDSDSAIDTIVWAIKWVLVISGILAVFAFIWAGFLYITTFVNEENNESAKKVMMYAAIGIVIILLSWTIVSFLTTFEL